MTRGSKVIIVVAVLLLVGAIVGVSSLFLFKKDASVVFAASAEVLKNPLMGFAPEATYEEAVSDNSLVYVDVTWRELEPEEGVFAFADIEEENELARWKAAGKHVVFRFVCDIPSDEAHMDIPDWLYEKTGDGVQYDISYGKGYSPDYSNEVFIAAHAKAIAALGSHFGQDTFFSYIELGSLGHWGEWHVKYDAGLPRIPSELVRRQYVKPYVEAFPNAKLLMRRPFTVAKEYGLGLFDDMAAHPEATEEWLDWIANGGDYNQANEPGGLVSMPNAWKTAPVGGEFNSDYTMDWMLRFNIDQTANLMKRSHTTFLGPKSPTGVGEDAGAQYTDGIAQVLRNMGYRLRVAKADISSPPFGNAFSVSLSWTNDGVAPMYWDWPVYLYLLDQSGRIVDKTPVDLKLTGLIGGTVKTKTDVSKEKLGKGSYRLCVGIEDPMTGEPAVSLAMEGERVGTLTVLYSWEE